MTTRAGVGFNQCSTRPGSVWTTAWDLDKTARFAVARSLDSGSGVSAEDAGFAIGPTTQRWRDLKFSRSGYKAWTNSGGNYAEAVEWIRFTDPDNWAPTDEMIRVSDTPMVAVYVFVMNIGGTVQVAASIGQGHVVPLSGNDWMRAEFEANHDVAMGVVADHARERWDEHCTGDPPEDGDELIATYFDRSSDGETYTIVEPTWKNGT